MTTQSRRPILRGLTHMPNSHYLLPVTVKNQPPAGMSVIVSKRNCTRFSCRQKCQGMSQGTDVPLMPTIGCIHSVYDIPWPILWAHIPTFIDVTPVCVALNPHMWFVWPHKKHMMMMMMMMLMVHLQSSWSRSWSSSPSSSSPPSSPSQSLSASSWTWQSNLN